MGITEVRRLRNVFVTPKISSNGAAISGSASHIIYTGTGRPPTCEQVTFPHRLYAAHKRVLSEYSTAPRPFRVLDIGNGSGNRECPAITSRQLAAAMPDAEVFGLDIDVSNIIGRIETGARDRLMPSIPYGLPNLKYIEADATKTLGVAPNSIDVALCFNMLAYLADDARLQVMKQVAVALKVGGKLFFHVLIVESVSNYLVLTKTSELEETLTWAK